MSYKEIGVIMVGICILCSCSRSSAPGSDSADSNKEIAQLSCIMGSDLTPEAEHWADSVLNTLTPSQMAAQLLMPASYTQCDATTMSLLTSYAKDIQVGGIAFHKGDTLSMHQISDSMQRAAPIPLFIAIDAENGLGMRLKGGTVYPLNYKLSESTERQMYDYGHNVGSECRAVGINMVFGPVLDVADSPTSYMYRRALGTDPTRVSELALAYARGLADTGTIPVGKHFPGHGSTRTDSHKALPISTKDRDSFIASDLLPFRRYIDLDFPALMAGHIAVPALSGDSTPADMSMAIITTLLRDELKYDGLIVTDAVSMAAVSHSNAKAAPVVQALLAGVDIVLAPEDTRAALEQILSAVEQGTLPLSTLRERCHRSLMHKYLYLRAN